MILNFNQNIVFIQIFYLLTQGIPSCLHEHHNQHNLHHIILVLDYLLNLCLIKIFMIYLNQCCKPQYFFFLLVNMVYLNSFNIHQHLEFIMVMGNVNLFIWQVMEPLYHVDEHSYHMDRIILLLVHTLLDLGIFLMFIQHIKVPQCHEDGQLYH